MSLRHGELTEKLLACIFEVHNEIGVGLDEEAYHQPLFDCLLRKDIPVVSKERKQLMHRGIDIRKFELDLLAFEKVILALKSLQCDFLQNHYVQIFSELKLWKKDLGLLVNFGRQKAAIERLLLDEKEKKIVEDYSEVKGKIDESTRQGLAKFREALLYVLETHGLGYGMTVCRDLLRAELDYRELAYLTHPIIDVKYHGKVVRHLKAKALCIADRFLCGITAIQDHITLFDVSRMRTYLKYSDIAIGVLINFGKSNLEIKALHR